MPKTRQFSFKCSEQSWGDINKLAVLLAVKRGEPVTRAEAIEYAIETALAALQPAAKDRKGREQSS